MAGLRVLVVSRLPAVRAGLRAMLDGLEEIEWVEESGPEGLEPASMAERADVVVFDAASEDGPAVLLDAFADMPVVRMVGHDDLAPVGAFRAGGAWLPREASAEEIAAAVFAAAQGLLVIHPSLSGAVGLAKQSMGAGGGEGEPLTEREHDVLDLMARGLANKSIAHALGISEHTVKFHVSAILGKLGASARTEAVTVALRRGLLTL